MTTQIKVLRENVIKSLSSIKDDNVSIADVAINRKRLLEALKLQNEDMLTINYGKVSWGDYNKYTEYNIEDETCIQFSCNHTIMRFLNRPTVKYGEPKVIPLNFIDHRTAAQVELTGIPIDSQEFIEALSFVIPCIASERTRPALNCILFDSDKDVIKLVSADGFRLGISKITAEGIPTDKVMVDMADIQRLMVFLKAIKPISSGKGKYYPEVYLSYGKTIKLSTKDGSIELEKQDFTFPDYQKLIPKDGTKIEFIASNMLEAAKALSKIANNGSGIIRLQFNAGDPCGKIQLTARSEELGDSTVECDAIVTTP